MITTIQFDHIKAGDKFKLSPAIYSQYDYDYIGPNLWTVIYKDINGENDISFTLKNDKGLRRYMDFYNRECWDTSIEPIVDLI